MNNHFVEIGKKPRADIECHDEIAVKYLAKNRYRQFTLNQ